MSLTRDVLSISPISLKDAFEGGLSVETINLANMAEGDRHFLGQFFLESGSQGQFYIERGPWAVRHFKLDGTSVTRCIHFTAPMLLHYSAAYSTHLRIEVLGPCIGAGNFGNVYRASKSFAIQDNGKIAAKAYSRVVKEQRHFKTHIRDIERESELGMQAGYLHMKPPIHVAGKSYIVSRYFSETVELFEVINSLYGSHHCYSADKLLRLISNMLYALKSQLHDRGIISRDIKPENILVNLATDEVFNIDLGLAQLINESGCEKSVGSLGYFSPEVISKSGMTVKSDIFSLGVTISLLLGARPDDGALQKNGGRCVTLPDMSHLFEHTTDLKETDRKMLRKMLDSMMAMNPDERISLKKAIGVVDRIILNRHLAVMPESIHGDVRQADLLAALIRDDLDLAQRAMKSYFSMDPFEAMDLLVQRLKMIANDGLNSLPDHPEAIKVFVAMLHAKRFTGAASRAVIQAGLQQDVAAYEDKKLKFEESRRALALRLSAIRFDTEKVAMVQQELGLIVTAMHCRVRSLAPTIDNLPILIRKLDKGVEELRRLTISFDGAKSGEKVYRIGLFNPSAFVPQPALRADGLSNYMKNK